MKKPIVAITMGDPAGIGPEVVVKALQKGDLQKICRPLVVGDSGLLSQWGWTRELSDVVSLTSLISSKLTPEECGRAAVRYLKRAVDFALIGKVQAVCTAPVSKERVQKSGLPFSGHTEYLRDLVGSGPTAMMMLAGSLRAVMVTRHLPLAKVAAALRTEDVVDAGLLLKKSLKTYFKIARPKIVVCALNPHAGENGLLGQEEKTIIAPAVKKLKARGCSVEGPLSADVAFARMAKGEFDAALGMYHDQVMIPLKTMDGSHLVNLTLGLPFVRTSPGHGTAFDIAGKNSADPGPMHEAIRLAAELASRS